MNTSRVSAFVGWAVILLVAFAALSANAFAAGMPVQWDPARVAANQDPADSFLLRPGEIVAGPGDGPAVAQVLSGWRQVEQRPFGLTLFTRTPQTSDPAREVLDAIAKVRKYTSGRPQGAAKVTPNYVFVGESAAGGPDQLHGRAAHPGRPRLHRAPGRRCPRALPSARPAEDGEGVRIAVLDTGMFEHEWLTRRRARPDSADTWDVDGDGYGDNESGHGTFIAGLILQVAPAASRLRRQGARLARRRRRLHGRQGDGAAAVRHRRHQPLARRLHRPRRAAAGRRHRDRAS